MWEQLAKWNNHFLQRELKDLSAIRISEMTNNEMTKYQSRRTDCNMMRGINKTWKSAHYFENRSELAYGFWALPKLLKELANDCGDIRARAIKSMSEYLNNPLHAQRAINDFDLVRRCQNTFLRICRRYQSEVREERQDLLKIFYILGMHRNGAKHIMQYWKLIKEFYKLLGENYIHSELICEVLNMLTRFEENVTVLIERYNAMDNLAALFQKDVCKHSYSPNLWSHLCHVFEFYPDLAVEKGFFEILRTRIQGRLPLYYKYDMKCFALLLRCYGGQKRFMEMDGVKEIYNILTYKPSIKFTTYEFVVLALMNGANLRPVMLRCREFVNLPRLILNLAKDSTNHNMQLVCLQCLRELGQMPCIKRYMQLNCTEDLEEMECLVETNARLRFELLYWLNREIYHISDVREIPPVIDHIVLEGCKYP